MKPTDLQIEDWVKWKDKYVQIAAISGIVYSFGHIDVELAHCGSGFIERHDLKSISPIPITSEILKRNGFVLDIRNGRYYCHVNGDDVWVRLPKEYAMYPYVDIIYSSLVHCPEDVTEVSHSNELHFPQRAYVHQFQQVLRICGLDDFANNFKIE